MTHSDDAQPERTGGRRLSGDATPLDADVVDVSQLVSILVAGRWKVLGGVLLGGLLGGFYLFVTPSQYRVDALLQLQADSMPAFQGVMALEGELAGSAGAAAQAEIEILRSRAVLGETVRRLGLQTQVEQRFLPVIGEPLWRLGSTTPAEGQVDVRSSSTRTLDVARFDVPDAWIGRELTLSTLGNQTYQVSDSAGRVILRGSVGTTASTEVPAGRVVIFVSDIAAASEPADFDLVKRPWLTVVEALSRRVSVAERGRDTGILEVSLQGRDRALIAAIVNTIADTYVRQNVEARSAEAEKSLEFLDSQLPELRAQLQAAEETFAEFRENRQAADLDQQGEALLGQLVELENRRSQLEFKLAELQQSYVGEHPALEAVREQQRRLSEDQVALEERIARLPEAQKEILRLRRDVEVNTALYTALLNRAQELRVLKAGTTGNVRIIDRAVEPIESVAPSVFMVSALSVFGGVGAGILVVFASAMLRRGVVDPREIENCGLAVYAIVPFSAWLARRSTQRRRGGGVRMPILAKEHPDEPAVEGLRSMRTNLYFAGGNEPGGRVLLISGPSPGVGKSFVSFNLGYLLAQVGHRVVVVDADLRKGRLHEFDDGERRDGLSQLISGNCSVEEVIRRVDDDNLFLITTGQLPPNPAELLMRESFHSIVATLREQFDFVILDGPPILAVTDAAIVASSVPDLTTFLVTRAGSHTLSEIEEAARRLSGVAENAVSGVIFNGLREEHVRYGGGDSSYYRYEYRPDKS